MATKKRIVVTPAHHAALSRLLDDVGAQPFRRSALASAIYPLTNPRDRDRADAVATALIREAAQAGRLERHGHLHWRRIDETRRLLSGREVADLAAPVQLTLTTRCPSKWAAVDLETGSIWCASARGAWAQATREQKADVLKCLADGASE